MTRSADRATTECKSSSSVPHQRSWSGRSGDTQGLPGQPKPEPARYLDGFLTKHKPI